MFNSLFPQLLNAVEQAIRDNANEVAELDRIIGDGDHIINLQRGLSALKVIENDLVDLDWSEVLMKVGMTLITTMGGASGSLFGTLFISMAKEARGQKLDSTTFSAIFYQGVESVKKRGKADIGEKTMLDTLIPVANCLKENIVKKIEFKQILINLSEEAHAGMSSTKDMIATKGRASYLGERAIGHIDAGARSSQLIICAITEVLSQQRDLS